MLLGAALTSDAGFVIDEIVIGDDACALPIDCRAPLLVLGHPQNTIDHAGIDRIEQHDVSETITRKNLPPKIYATFKSGKHGKRRLLSESRYAIRERNEQCETREQGMRRAVNWAPHLIGKIDRS